MAHLDKDMLKILLIEDDDIDAAAIHRAFNKKQIQHSINRARNGIEALELTRNSLNDPNPFMVLLDLNLPIMSGFEYLNEVRNDAQLQHVVVFVLTTSAAPEDKKAAYSKNVAGYIVKNSLNDSMHEFTSMLQEYWKLNEFL